MNTGNLFGGQPEFDKEGIKKIIEQIKKESRAVRNRLEYEFCPICRYTMNSSLGQADNLSEDMLIYSESNNNVPAMFELINDKMRTLAYYDMILDQHGKTHEHKHSNPFDRE
tara:strand:+ start:522 stop:857 length:336 start_codon:yes stop_codon:yes gene_type:complete